MRQSINLSPVFGYLTCVYSSVSSSWHFCGEYGCALGDLNEYFCAYHDSEYLKVHGLVHEATLDSIQGLFGGAKVAAIVS